MPEPLTRAELEAHVAYFHAVGGVYHWLAEQVRMDNAGRCVEDLEESNGGID